MAKASTGQDWILIPSQNVAKRCAIDNVKNEI